MNHLSDDQIESLRRRLLDAHQRLQERSDEFTHDGVEYSRDTGDRQDIAAAEAARANAAGLAAHERRHLIEVNDAISRIEAGTYGICEVTGEPIPFARLDIEPTARTTVEGQEELEAESAADKESTDAY